MMVREKMLEQLQFDTTWWCHFTALIIKKKQVRTSKSNKFIIVLFKKPVKLEPQNVGKLKPKDIVTICLSQLHSLFWLNAFRTF